VRDGSATYVVAATISVFTMGCIIIAHEVSGELRQSLVSLTGHHWLSVSLIALALFVMLSIILHFQLSFAEARSALKADDLQAWSLALAAVTLVMMLSSLAVYLRHYLGA
jgi:hypothetical protein